MLRDAMKVGIVSTMLLSGSMTSFAVAADEDLNDMRCRDVVIMTGADRDATIAFMQGFLLGQSGKSTVDVDKMTDATADFLTACVGKPNDNAMATMKATSK